MKKWVVVGAAAALVAAASVAILTAVQRSRHQRALGNVPELISDCVNRIQQLEAELTRRRPTPEPVG